MPYNRVEWNAYRGAVKLDKMCIDTFPRIYNIIWKLKITDYSTKHFNVNNAANYSDLSISFD